MLLQNLLFLAALLLQGGLATSIPRRIAPPEVCHTNAECLQKGLPPLRPRIKRDTSTTFEYTGGVQTYNFVPGKYQIYAAGAQGGQWSTTGQGGMGAFVNWTITIGGAGYTGEILVGGRPRESDGTLSRKGGGGGGTFLRSSSSAYQAAIGGGGGATSLGSGLDAVPSGGGTGRTGGNGGGTGATGVGGRGSSQTTGYANCGGGAGFSGAGGAATALDHGQSGTYFSPAQGGNTRPDFAGGLGEYRTLNNEAGGPIDPDNVGGSGGYGGGGGAAINEGGGGGGGFGGGGGGHDGGAGGGGSTAIGGTVVATGADRIGDGIVIITPIV